MPETRNIAPQEGMRCWTRQTPLYRLPPGLPEHTAAVIIRIPPPKPREKAVAIVEALGREWTIDLWMADCGIEFKTRHGNWIPESDPRVRDFALKFITSESTRPYHTGRSSVEMIAHYRWILERNGWDVPD